VVWSFFYLALCRLLQLVVLLCRSERSKELEILLLRHELAILRRQPRRVPFRPVDRALLAALARALPRSAWASLSVRPTTLLRWHSQMVRRRWTYPYRRPGRPPLDRRLETLVVRLARENPRWGYRRIVGELRSLGISVSATSVRTILIRHGLPPAPQRDELSWRAFLRQHAATTLACDFFTVETAWLKRIYVLFFLSLETRRIEFVACTPNPTGVWVAQQARNLLMTLDDCQRPVRFLIHDRDAKFNGGCDHVFESEGIAVIRTPVQAPNANAHAERWVGSVPRVPRPPAHLQPPPPRARASRLCPPLQPASAASSTRASTTRAGRRKPNTAPSGTRSAAKSHRPARRADPRIRTRSLRPDHSPYLRRHKLFGGTSTHSPLIRFTRARKYQTDRVDVNYSPVRFDPVLRSRN
jgi:putative transposase